MINVNWREPVETIGKNYSGETKVAESFWRIPLEREKRFTGKG